MTADAALQRFDIKIFKEDANYIYLAIRPLTEDDRKDFASMTLALYQPATGYGYIPAMVRFQKGNLAQETEDWSFEKPYLNAPNNVAGLYTPRAIAANDPAWKVTDRNAQPGLPRR